MLVPPPPSSSTSAQSWLTTETCPHCQSSWQPPWVQRVWEQGTGLCPMARPAVGHKAAAKGAPGSDRALEMKAAVFAFPKCRCVPEGLQLPRPAGLFFFFLPSSSQ